MRTKPFMALCCLLLALLLAGCGSSLGGTAYSHARFSITLPEGWERTDDTNVLCFAPNGNPVRSSQLTVSLTQKNYYFSKLTAEEYATGILQNSQYEDLSLVSFEKTCVNGFDAHRVAFKVTLEQGEHDLILYAVDSYSCYFFSFLCREEDDLVSTVDAMMDSVRLFDGN